MDLLGDERGSVIGRGSAGRRICVVYCWICWNEETRLCWNEETRLCWNEETWMCWNEETWMCWNEDADHLES